VEEHVEEERGVDVEAIDTVSRQTRRRSRHQCGGGRRGVEADAVEEQAPVGVSHGNGRVSV
jgi:hypothetical protein